MIRELLTCARSDASAAARQLGLAREHAAIAARFERVGSAWAPHLSASHEMILAGARRCRHHRMAMIIGAGDCRDVPVTELVELFEAVVLADVVIGPAARGWARGHPGRVICLAWDATGVLEELALRRALISAPEVVQLFAEGHPRLPIESEPDLIVSANCLSQLGLIPSHSLPLASQDDALVGRCSAAAARSHLRWLSERNGVRVLLGDRARLDVARDGSILHREDLKDHLPDRPPDRSWRWQLAPIPEISRSFHRVHEVGAWIDGGTLGGL